MLTLKARYVFYMSAVMVALVVLGLEPQMQIPKYAVAIAACYWGSFLFKLFLDGFYPKCNAWSENWRNYGK